jgi:hypothetical protein
MVAVGVRVIVGVIDRASDVPVMGAIATVDVLVIVGVSARVAAGVFVTAGEVISEAAGRCPLVAGRWVDGRVRV